MRFHYIFVVLFISISLSGVCFAGDASNPMPLQGVVLENQFGDKVSVENDARFLLFTVDKKGSDLLNEVLEPANQAYLDAHKIYLLADISTMPGIITKMFALPKMRTRPYSLMLDYEGVMTSKLPHKDGHVAVLELETGVISNSLMAADEETLKSLLPEIPPPAEPE